MFYDEFGVYEINKNDKVLHVDIYQEDEDWVLYVSKPRGLVEIALLKNDMEDFDFDGFFDYSYKYVYNNFDVIIDNINTLEQVYKCL